MQDIRFESVDRLYKPTQEGIYGTTSTIGFLNHRLSLCEASVLSREHLLRNMPQGWCFLACDMVDFQIWWNDFVHRAVERNRLLGKYGKSVFIDIRLGCTAKTRFRTCESRSCYCVMNNAYNRAPCYQLEHRSVLLQTLLKSPKNRHAL